MRKASYRARRIVIRGQRWRIVLGRPPKNNCSALCDYETRTIWVRQWNEKKRVSAKDRRDCVLHEILHCCFPDLKEEAIEEAEEALARGLELVA